MNRAEDPSGERRSQIDRTLFRGRAAVRYLAVWNAPAYPDRPLTAPEKARGPWTTKDYLSRVLQETSNEMVDALLAATQADLISAFCRMLSVSGCFLLFAVRCAASGELSASRRLQDEVCECARRWERKRAREYWRGRDSGRSSGGRGAPSLLCRQYLSAIPPARLSHPSTRRRRCEHPLA